MIKRVASIGVVLMGMLFASTASAGYIHKSWNNGKGGSFSESRSYSATKSFGYSNRKIKPLQVFKLISVLVHHHRKSHTKTVPEPGTLGMVALGLLGLGAARRLRRS